MTERHDVAMRAAVLKVLADRLGDAKTAVGEEITGAWRPKDRNAAVLPGGSEVGAVTLVAGAKKARITDQAAFEAWTKEVHPEQWETVTVTRLNPAWLERLMSAAKKLGEPRDGETGQEVPGLVVEEGDPYPRVTLAKDAAERVAEAWQRGDLAGLLAAVLPAVIESGKAG